MMKMLLVIFMSLLQNYILFVNAECNTYTDTKQKSKDVEVTSLHHITEFDKRDQIRAKDCRKQNHTNGKNSSKFPSPLGLRALLHVRSQKGKQQGGTRREYEPSIYDALAIKTPKEQGGIKRTEDEQKKLHKVELRTETIRMLHKIVEKYFPGGHLSVDQKIKALKILGKLIKLKKEGKNADIKAILDSLPKKSINTLKDEGAGGSKLKKAKQDKVSESEDKISKNNYKDTGGGSSEGDIYATIANGPDMPKLPPVVSGKDSGHAHSNIMPVGVQPMADGGGLMNAINHPNYISDQMGDFSSERRGNLSPEAGLGLGQIYNTGNSYYNDKYGLSGTSMMNGAADTRSRMSFSPRYRHRGSYDDDNGDEDNDEVDDYANDDDDENGDDEEESALTRSHVHRQGYDDDDEDDEDVVEFRNRFNRKDKIAKSPNKGNNPLQSKGKKLKSLVRH